MIQSISNTNHNGSRDGGDIPLLERKQSSIAHGISNFLCVRDWLLTLDHNLEDIILYRYISLEYVPIQYRGLSRENDTEFSTVDGGVSELLIKPGV